MEGLGSRTGKIYPIREIVTPKDETKAKDVELPLNPAGEELVEVLGSQTVREMLRVVSSPSNPLN